MDQPYADLQPKRCLIGSVYTFSCTRFRVHGPSPLKIPTQIFFDQLLRSTRRRSTKIISRAIHKFINPRASRPAFRQIRRGSCNTIHKFINPRESRPVFRHIRRGSYHTIIKFTNSRESRPVFRHIRRGSYHTIIKSTNSRESRPAFRQIRSGRCHTIHKFINPRESRPVFRHIIRGSYHTIVQLLMCLHMCGVPPSYATLEGIVTTRL